MIEQRLTPAQIEDIKARFSCDSIAGRFTTLRRGTGGAMIGACPVCSSDRNSRTATRFEVWPDRWVCAVCEDGGDVIALVQRVNVIPFMEAVEWLGGPQTISAADSERMEREATAKRDQSVREANVYREKERAASNEIWRDGKPIAGTAVEEYHARRNLIIAPGAKVRSLAALAYWENVESDKFKDAIWRGPAMLLPIINAAGKFSGVHMTYLDLAQPKGKLKLLHPKSKAELPAKKMRGVKRGGYIEVAPCPSPHTLVVGEGYETVASVYRAYAECRRDLDGIAFWASGDLGNLAGGKALDKLPHPTEKTANGRTKMVPGVVPDPSVPGIPVPDSVTTLILLGDGDSDAFTTQCVIARAGARYAKPGRQILAAWAPEAGDFNDLAPDWQRILDLIDLARAPVPPLVPADSRDSAKKDAPRERRDQSASPSAAAAPAAPDQTENMASSQPPTAANVVAFPGASAPAASSPAQAEKEPSSQMGGSEQKSGDGRRGAGGRATARRNRGGAGRDFVPVDMQRLHRRLAFFPQTDLGNAERFRERHRGRLLFCEALGWLYWDGKRWAIKGAPGRVSRAEHETVRAIQDEAQTLIDLDEDVLIGSKTRGRGKDAEVEQTYLSDTLRAWGRASESHSRLTPISKQARTYFEIASDQLDADKFKLNVNNGTLTIYRDDAGVPQIGFEPHEPRDLITKVSPVDYDPAARCPMYDKFLSEVQPKEEMRRFLHQWKGLSLTGDTSVQRLAMFWGKGKNGKSVFEDATAYVAGDYGESIPIETFLTEGRGRNAGQATPDLAILPGVRMLRTSEPKRGAKLDEALIKLATGGEPIQARHLNMPYFKFYPQLKMTISGNYRPDITGTDEGIWRRVMLVRWNYYVPEERRDLMLFDKLKREGSGILNRLLEGVLDWMTNGLVEPDDVKAATADYRADSDPLGRFLKACVEKKDGSRVQSSELHRLFCAWAKVNGATEWSARGFSMAMKERGYVSDKSSVMYWEDIAATKLVTDFVDSDGKPIKQEEQGEETDVPAL